jgi:F-type H+-transporting ATPase subunit gamma
MRFLNLLGQAILFNSLYRVFYSRISVELLSSATLRALIREYLFVSLFRACAESLASENASRLAAMQRAEKNIDELLEDLNGTFHRLRQSGIDEELFDVISGFEALVEPRQRPGQA